MALAPWCRVLRVAWLVAAAGGWTTEPAGASAPAEVVVAPVYINQLAEELRAQHPALEAAKARRESAAAGVAAVRLWEDPAFKVGGMFADEERRADEGDILYGVEQRIPLFNKPALARRVAEAGTDVAQANLDARFQLLRRDLAWGLFRTALAERTVQIGQEDLAWLDAMIASLEQRYRAGDASQVWLLRLQNDRAQRAEALRTDQQQLAHEHFALNRLLHRDPAGGWPMLRLPAPAVPVVYTPRLVELALRFEPQLKVLRHELRQGDASVALARRQRYPEVGVGLEGRNYTGNGEFRQAEFMVNFNLPLGNRSRYRSDIRREEAWREALRADLADAELSLREEVHGLTVKIDAARREALLYRDEILPRSELALASAQTAWSANRGQFLEVLEARRMLLEARLKYARAVAAQYERLSDLVLRCGLADLEALSTLSAPASEPTPAPPLPPQP